jgi:MFS family permease
MLPESLKDKPRPARKLSLLNVAAIREAFQKREIGNLVLVFFFYTVAFSALYVAFPLFSKEILGYDAAQNGYFFAYVGLIGIVIQGGAIGKLAHRLGEKSLLIAGLASLFVSLALVPGTHGLPRLIISATLLAIGSALITPSLTSLISKYAGAGEHGIMLGVSQSFSSLGRVIGPFLGGIIFATAGIAWPFYAGSIMTVIALILAVSVPSWIRG